MNESYVSYEAACEMTGIQKLSDRRSDRCLDYGIQSLKHYQNSRFFPLNQNVKSHMNIRDRQPYHVNFARTSQYKNSAIPYVQRRLNEHAKKLEAEAGVRTPQFQGTGAGGLGTGVGGYGGAG